MAKNRKAKLQDEAAAKAKKQKIILVCAGVAFLGLGAVQGPKLMKQLHPAAPKPAVVAAGGTATPTPAAPTTAVVATPGATAVVHTQAVQPQRTAILAGVTLKSDALPAAGDSQLRSFSLFVAKDPFVPQASDESATTSATTASPPPPPAKTTGSSSGSGGSSSQPAGTPPPAPTDATITMNGEAYALTVKGSFPKADPLFVLVSLKKNVAKIGVAGGSFQDGKTVPLKMGKQVTLVNDATGARYSLKLVYTGAGPEQTQSFTQAKK